MSERDAKADSPAGEHAPFPEQRRLTPEAERALAEAAARRKAADAQAAAAAEVGGRDGPAPVRFGDWEKGGIATDF